MSLSGVVVLNGKPSPNHLVYVNLKGENILFLFIQIVGEDFTDVHLAQVLTYLMLGNDKLGLLLNFHTTVLKMASKELLIKLSTSK